jgi:hypothetical protein
LAQFIRVIDFEKLQHYHDRNPPWIKLHRSLLADWRILELSEGDRWHLLGLYLLASETDNLIPYRPSWIKQRLSLTRPISLKTLTAMGYIELVEQDASGLKPAIDVLADDEQGNSPRALARVEESRVEESRVENIYIAHGEFGNCKLLAEEHAKLTAKLNGNLNSYIARFDRWIEEAKNPKTGLPPPKLRNRKAYLSILNWWERDGGGNGNGTNGKREGTGQTSGANLFGGGAFTKPYTPRER